MPSSPTPPDPQRYHYATGFGTCPKCQSPNVRQYRIDLSSLPRILNRLARFFRPHAATPLFLRRLGFECQACSHRWP